MTYNTCQNILFLAAIFKFKINGNDEPNRYANKCLQDAQNSGVVSNVRITLWHNACEKEVRLFIALILAVGIISNPELKLYWTRDYILQTSIFHETFSLKRFQLLFRYLHFVNDEDADNDRLRKIRPLLEMLRTLFRKTHMPEQNILVDESLMLFKGRLLMKQYTRVISKVLHTALAWPVG